MKRTNKLSLLLVVLFFLNVKSVIAQTKEDLFIGTMDVTWLGLDFTQAKFFGEAAGFGSHGEVTNADFKDKYIPGWNQLFINEPKKFDIAKQVHRTEVKYAIDVTGHQNSTIKKDFFTNDPSQLNSLDAAKVEALVKKYDFMGKKGIGLIFFVEGMNKVTKEGSAWAAYVNMDKKSVIMSSRLTGKPSGFGFKNFWAGAFSSILKDADYKDWK